jgi:hypothetical protein
MPFAALAIGGGIVKGAGAIQQAKATDQADKYNSAVARENAQLATQNADWTAAEGEQQVGMAGLEGQQKSGQIKSAQAANGVDVNSGSALGVQQSQSEMNMLNQMNIRSNAARAAYGYQVQSTQDIGQAQLDTAAGKAALQAGDTAALGDILSGGASAGQYMSSPTGDTKTQNPTDELQQEVSAEDQSTGYLNTQNTNSFNNLIGSLSNGSYFNSGVTG